MSLFGPLPARRFLEILRRIGGGVPDRALLADILDGAIESVGAERAFLLRERPGGGFRALIARTHEGSTISRPAEAVSHHAVRRTQETREVHIVADARRDRRYRTEEAQRTRRQPASIFVFPLRIRGSAPEAFLYLDHRFHSLPEKGASVEAGEHWAALLEISLQARERERRMGRDVPPAVSEASPAPVPGDPSSAAVEPLDFHGLLAASPDMLDLVDAVRLLGKSDLAVVIQGETGTGKERVARAIHLASARAGKPFQIVTCGGLPDSLLESELFGHVRGAYTGADTDRRGLLAEADGGTVLLDEVGDMSPLLQQSLLRVLQDGLIRPLGGKEAVRVDVRILSSTHRDLGALVEEGAFRRDLFYRLRGTVLQVPPLRERREEIRPLAARFLERFSGDEGRKAPAIGDGALRRLLRYGWPGNVRELENEMRRLAAIDVTTIDERHLSPFLLKGQGEAAPRSLEISGAVSEAERKVIAAALARAGGNKSRAAKMLGITRKALYRRMARYGLR